MDKPEEYKVLNDKEYEDIGRQLSLDNWMGATLVGLVALFFVVVMFYIGKFIGIFINWML